MTPAEIRAKAEELRALLEQATPGPWESHCGYLVRAIRGDEAVPIAEMRGPYRYRVGLVRGHYEQDANLALIVAAVNALPALLAEVETHRADDAAADPFVSQKARADYWHGRAREVTEQRDALRAEVETLTAALLSARAEALREAATECLLYAAGADEDLEAESYGHAVTARVLASRIRALATNQEPADE